MTDQLSDNGISMIEIYCDGRPGRRHDRRPIARMVRTLHADGSTGWGIARESGRRSSADRNPADDVDGDRYNLECSCGASARAHYGRRSYHNLVAALDAAAVAGQSEVPLSVLPAIVSSNG